MRLLAFDPGKTTGVALLEDHELLQFWNLEKQELFHFLDEDHYAELYVVENYRIRPPSAQGGRNKKFNQFWSSVEPAKVIGAIEYSAQREGLQVVLQEPSIKPIAYRLINWEGKGHTPHHIDAYAHGAYWFHKHQGPKGK